MGKQLAAKVRAQPHWDSTVLAVLQYLAYKAKGHIVRGVGQSELSDVTQRSLKRIKVVMQQLRAEGIVEIIERGRGTRTNVYRLHLNGKPGAA